MGDRKPQTAGGLGGFLRLEAQWRVPLVVSWPAAGAAQQGIWPGEQPPQATT